MPYIRQRGTSWYYTISLGIVKGKHKKIERFAGKTKREATRNYYKAMEEISMRGQHIDVTNLSVADYLTEWMQLYTKVNLKPNTYSSYQRMIANHIVPALGIYKLQNISPSQLQNFINDKALNYSRSTLVVLKGILKKSFAYAFVTAQYLKYNPAEHLIVPKNISVGSSFEKQLDNVPVFTQKQMDILLERFAYPHQFFIPIVLAYHTGMRLGECLALEWKNINFKTQEIMVNATLTDHDKVRIITTPKTASSVRSIAIDDKLSYYLLRHKKVQLQDSHKYQDTYTNSDYVCTMPQGTPLSSDNLRYFGMYCKQTFGKESNLSFHSLRHTHATMLLSQGIELAYISKRLGHSNITTTANIYTHITPEINHDITQKLNNLF